MFIKTLSLENLTYLSNDATDKTLDTVFSIWNFIVKRSFAATGSPRNFCTVELYKECAGEIKLMK